MTWIGNCSFIDERIDELIASGVEADENPAARVSSSAASCGRRKRCAIWASDRERPAQTSGWRVRRCAPHRSAPSSPSSRSRSASAPTPRSSRWSTACCPPLPVKEPARLVHIKGRDGWADIRVELPHRGAAPSAPRAVRQHHRLPPTAREPDDRGRHATRWRPTASGWFFDTRRSAIIGRAFSRRRRSAWRRSWQPRGGDQLRFWRRHFTARRAIGKTRRSRTSRSPSSASHRQTFSDPTSAARSTRLSRSPPNRWSAVAKAVSTTRARRGST